MMSIRGSLLRFAILHCSLLLSFLNIASAFAIINPGSNSTIGPVYQISRWSNVSVSSLTQVPSLEASSVAKNNNVTVNTRAQLVGLANTASSLATHTATMPSLKHTSLATLPTKMNTTVIPGTVVYITKTKGIYVANMTSSAIAQTSVSHSPNTTIPVIPRTTPYVTIAHTFKTVARAAASSEYRSGNSSIADLSGSLSSLSYTPSRLKSTFGQAPTSATITLSSGSRMTNLTTVPLNGTPSTFPSATQLSNSTFDRAATMVVKVLSSESQSVNSMTTISTCTSCASSSVSSNVNSTSGIFSTTKSAPIRIHASRTSEVAHGVSVSSSVNLSVPTTTSQNQTVDTTSTSLSSKMLTRARSSRSQTKATSVEPKTTLLRSSSTSSKLSLKSVTARTTPKQTASSSTDGPATIQTVTTGNDKIIILPRAAVVRPSPTQNTGSTSAAVPTALPPVDPAQHARHVAKIAEIVAPSVVGGAGFSITVPWAIWDFFKKKALAEGKAGVEVVNEQSAVVQRLARVSRVLRLSEDTVWPGDIGEDLDRVADIENSILQEEAVNTGILTRAQIAQIRDVFTAPPPPPGPLPEDTSITDPPSSEDPPIVGPPFDIQPPKYDDPQSVQFADKLPPISEPLPVYIDNIRQDYSLRMVPEAYRDLSFDAKIFYASKYGQNVWDQALAYENGESAAVGPDNKPFRTPRELELDSAGNVVSYMGIPVEDLETRGFPKDGSWKEQQAKLKEIRKAIHRTRYTVKADIDELNRINDEEKRFKSEQNKARIRKLEKGLEDRRKANEKKAKEEADKQAKDEADRKAREEADERAKEEADRQAKEEADKKAKEEADQKAKEKADKQAKEEADRKAKEEADRQAKEEADKRAKEEADRKAKEEADRKAKEEAEERDQEAREKEKTGDSDDPNNINAGLWTHKPLCGPDTTPADWLRWCG